MVAQQKRPKPLFEDKDPQDYLLSQLFERLSREEQLKYLEEAIIKRAHHKSAKDFLSKLEAVFGGNNAEYRTYLRKLFCKLPKRKEVNSSWDLMANKSVPVFGPVAVDLKIEMLNRLMFGWRWEKGFAYNDVDESIEESEVCFRFICKLYESVRLSHLSGSSSYLKKICKVFRESLKNWGKAYELDQWILWEHEILYELVREIIPEEFVEMMIKARTRFGGVQKIGKEIEFLASFGFHHRSDKAKEIVSKLMKKIRRTEELIKEFLEMLKLKSTFGFAEKGTFRFENGIVEFELESADTVRVTVNVMSSYKYKYEDCPELTSKIQKARDEFLAEKKSDIQIKIIVCGPMKFKFEEE